MSAEQEPGPGGVPGEVPPSADPASTELAPLDVVVVTGLSGAGKNTAGRVLEDLGFFVVDNLPPALVADMVRMVEESHGHEQAIAVVGGRCSRRTRVVTT